MPSTTHPADKKDPPVARQLSLPRRLTSESRRSPTKEPSLNSPNPRHGLTLDSSMPDGNARVAMSNVPKDQFPQSLNEQFGSDVEPLPTNVGVASAVAPNPQQRRIAIAPHPSDDVTYGRRGKDEKNKHEEVESLHDVTPSPLSESQIQLNRYRERLARDLERREMATRGLMATPPEKVRVSPILEESGSPQQISASALATTSSGLTTTSTESGNTIRGGITPGFIAGTPSYPFPRMSTPGYSPATMNRSFGNMSPTAAAFMSQTMPFEGFGAAHDKVLSGSSTPASALTFLPAGAANQLESDFPSPNLYDLSLMLSAEPGLDAWWNTVVQVMRDVYKAERVTLAVPADSTDIENVPWGQKATYNEHQEDDLSLGYMARGSSLIPSSAGDVPSEEVPLAEDSQRARLLPRPGIQTRHSFTAYEDCRERKGSSERLLPSRRPAQLGRSKSYFPPGQPADENEQELSGPSLNKSALAEHDAEEQNVPSWEIPLVAKPEIQGRVLPVLQALDYEADPLIDHSGVMRVLERGKVIALTRSYPYLQNLPEEPTIRTKVTSKSSSTDPVKKKVKGEASSKLSTILGGANSSRNWGRTQGGDKTKASSIMSRLEDDEPRPPTPKYEEFEQAPPSPWSQSPAPSPAVRADPTENPFFTDAMVDEDSFNPGSDPADYAGMRPPEAIGVDNSWTVLHIPLTHLLLSKPIRPFRLDNSVLEQKTHARNKSEIQDHSGDNDESDNPSWQRKDKPAPIAILSLLSPIIPYPSNLRHSLEYLAPHLATSFSMCRHYTNLETELAGLNRRRPQTAGFGAIAADGRPLAGPVTIGNLSYLPADDIAAQRSLGGSITSPSDYSGLSKSAAGSPMDTPNWDQGSLHQLIDKRGPATSPAQLGGDGYFNAKHKSSPSRAETISTSSKMNRISKENSSVDRKHTCLPSGQTPHAQETASTAETGETGETRHKKPDSRVSTPGGIKRVLSNELQNYLDEIAVLEPRLKRSEQRGPESSHTLLHSYGADFATSFQSLPPSSSVVSKPVPHAAPSRTGSTTAGPVDMPPPSDRLKGLILDSLPTHVFVSLPQTGEIVWVNSRYLTYRGQTVADLAVDPWGSIHPDDRDEYLKAWSHSLRTGEQFSRTVRIRRFDGAYRWFYARAVASRDKRGVMMQFLGSYMDIHDQHIAELKAARQEEVEASEAKHRLLANLIPQIIFTATENEGITFANEQWLSYTGQSFEDSLGLGFMDFVHPDDLAKCQIPTDIPPTPLPANFDQRGYQEMPSSETALTSSTVISKPSSLLETNLRGVHQALSRNNSSGSSSVYEMPTADLTELAKKGIIKVTTDSNGRLSYTTEVRLRSKKGEYRWHLIRCVEIDNIDFGNGASSFFGSATDINDHKLLEAKLKEAMESKSRFLSNMSHEIRTPLIGISGMVSFLQDTTLNEEQRDYTNTIQTSANSLLMIINDILDLSKVDAGMMKLKYEWFHTRSLIEDVNELVSTMAIAKRLELNYVVEENVPAWVKGDKVRIRQVLLNVIGNAIKFTAEGEVFSRCKIVTDGKPAADADQIMLEFAVMDTGRGFTQEEAELIFKPFSQIDGSSTRQHGGSGLGLVISRQLVELHGGKMEGAAVPGKGSTFTFTAKFALPTQSDHPDAPKSPKAFQSLIQSPKEINNIRFGSKAAQPPKPASTASPASDPEFVSPAPASSGSSDPSIHSNLSHVTERTSVSSVNVGLVHFSEAARASGQDLSQMKLELPTGDTLPGANSTSDTTEPVGLKDFRPPMYSILIICPQTHSREATAQHIETTLPKDVPHQITALDSVEKAQRLLGGEDSVNFTHIVLNLPSPEEIIGLMERIMKSTTISGTTILVLSDSVQRQAVMRLAAGSKYEQLVSENLVTFIYKPVKPSRFAVIFDPEKVRDLSIDRNRSTAQRMVETQKASYQEIEKRMGNKGYKVLLVEDNPVNQKVLKKYLKKVGVEVEVAADGAECTDMVFSHEHSYYSLILCDLHMPRKDGYQACREIRQWETEEMFNKMPIIALSANVMSDVQDKCVAAGFSDYVTKPVDFIDLSRAMSKFF
ncbi:histidine kinase hhk2p [Colletotrichum plurivorum]|uniref:histidine kinase n=1 Tax=Colletotrichum plurivorum TaxID=2175906 RepID=A0A8H6JDP8_9PEZI|nr:histidine kinase hhk2p [Colletotrichum plurivorum]